MYNRHYQIHVSNPHVNYVIFENCGYCKKARIRQYSNLIDRDNLNNLERLNNNQNGNPYYDERDYYSYPRNDEEYEPIQNQYIYEPVYIPLTVEQLNKASILFVYNDFTKYIKNEESKIICSICQDNIKNGDIIRQFKYVCNHMYHHNCIDKWIEKNHKCPNCRTDLRY
jgi:hypothetical protein